jgi:hypothetical protein
MLLFGHVWDAKSDGRSESGRSSRRERSSGSPPSLPTARKGPLLSVRPSRGRSRGGNGAHPRREGDLAAAKGASDFQAGWALHFNDHIDEAGDIVFRHACKLGFEGIVSKRLGSPYVSGRSRHWIKSKNSITTAMMTKSALAAIASSSTSTTSVMKKPPPLRSGLTSDDRSANRCNAPAHAEKRQADRVLLR